MDIHNSKKKENRLEGLLKMSFSCKEEPGEKLNQAVITQCERYIKMLSCDDTQSKKD